ncbi:hypothetical protein [Streptococcus suis]|uniref:hypothetical protein n=1 Tax=Streptococcus suis TaxID=1307 RepID=UPI0014325071|nr:hypothetical protein [Streptococcus suis]NJW40125.1 hypothetical protein [Streptococcus suis]
MKNLKEKKNQGTVIPLGIASFSLLMGVSLLLFAGTAGGLNIILSVPPLIVAGLGFFYVKYRRETTIKMYNKMYDRYPELQNNLQLLVDKADYYDSAIGIVVYKHLIVSLKDGIKVFHLDEVVWLYLHILRGGFASIYSQTLMVGTVLNDRHTLLSLPILGTSRVADPNIENLFEFIGTRHPKIMLGYTNENNQFWGVLRSEDKNQKTDYFDFLR